MGRIVVITVAVLAVVFAGGPFVYIHFIEGPAPKPLSLPPSTATGRAEVPSGVWRATSASTVGYRVHEVLFGQSNEAVGRTHSVTGSITLSHATVTHASFTVEMSTVHSDQHRRDVQFDGRIMDVAKYPTATFTLGAPIALNAHDRAGVPVSALATGDLSLRGQTHRVTFDLTASYTAKEILINGAIPIDFATWHIPVSGFAGITIGSHGTVEFLLTLHPGTA
jgi:polyisoprenoid-binding protein YceI